MTAKDDVIARLQHVRPELQTHSVRELWLFGSVARGEAHDTSDVDILVDFSAPVTLFEFLRLQRHRPMSPQPYAKVAAGYATALVVLLALLALLAPRRPRPDGLRGRLSSELRP